MNASTRLTALVVTCNEGHLLKACLESLKPGCEELVVVDLESTDDSVAIAREMGAKIISHVRVPVVEMVWPDVVGEAFSPWILRADPDEVMSPELLTQIRGIISSKNSVGMIRLPHRFYFCGKPLLTTRWGKIKASAKVFHRERVDLTYLVHSGIRCKEGFNEKTIPATSNESNVIQHYWVESYGDLFKKHWRYIRKEGEAQFRSGKRFRLWEMIRETWKAFYFSFVVCRGYRGGLAGIFLSFFHAFYVKMSFLSLYCFEIRRK